MYIAKVKDYTSLPQKKSPPFLAGGLLVLEVAAIFQAAVFFL
jgi:hypothetical protein